MNNFLALGLRACSACSGDYEDPDESSWSEEENDGEEFAREKEFGEVEKDADAEA